MFNNPGAKIKGLAKTLFTICVVLTILGCIGMMAAEVIDEDMFFLVPVIAVLSIGASYLSCLFLAAFGELVETNTALKASNEQLLEEAKAQTALLKGSSEFTKN